VEIPILVEPVANGRYRAKAGEPFALVVEAPSRQEALTQLDLLIQQRLSGGAEVVPMRLTALMCQTMPEEVFKEDPLFDEWLALIAENRLREEAPNP
jgi:hypothetical protein